MKRCPDCRRDYFDDSLLYCLDDGCALLDGPATAERDEPDTAMMPEGVSAPHKGADQTETRFYPTGKSRRHKMGVIVAAVALVALAGFGFGLYKVFENSVSGPERPAAIGTITRLTGDGKTRGAKVSPDGKFLAYIRAEGTERSIWLKQIQTNSNIEIVKQGELSRFYGLAFSPDGNFIYFNAWGSTDKSASVYRVPTLGGSPTKAFTNAFFVEFSPDGRQASFTRVDISTNEHSVYVANVDGSNERKLASRFNEHYLEGAAPWSADGKHVAVLTGDDTLAPGLSVFISIISVADGSVLELGESRWHNIHDLAWHPDGDSIIISGTENTSGHPQLFEMGYPSGVVRRITNNLHSYYSVSITADGQKLVTEELYFRSAVWVSPDQKPENARPVMPDSGDTWGIGWTPDNRIVYISDQTGDPEVWIMDADGTNAKPITHDRIAKTAPVVSPDGRYILYSGNPSQGEIIRINIDGSGRTVLANDAGSDNPDVSRDSNWVIYSAWVNGRSSVLRVPIEGGEPQVLTEGHAIEPRYSQDGTKIAYFVLNPETLDWSQLAVIPAEGGAPVKVFHIPANTNIGRGPVWTPDDTGILLVTVSGERQELWRQPVDGSPGELITDVGLPGIERREYSRDGKRIALVRAQRIGNAIMITDFR